MEKSPGILQRLRLAMASRAPLTDDEKMTLAKFLPGGTRTAPDRTTRGLQRAYSRSPWVRAVASKISDSVGSARWALFGTTTSSGKFVKSEKAQGGGVDMKAFALGETIVDGLNLVPITDHPALRLLYSSNPMFPGHVARSLTQTYLDLTGEAFWLLEPQDVDGKAVPERFWPIPTSWVVSMPTATDPFWEVQTPSWKGKFPAAAVFRFVTPDPENPYNRGSGHFRSLGDEIDTDEFAARHVRAWFLNKARPDMIVFGEGLGDKDVKRLEVGWLQAAQGFVRAHRPFFMNRKVDVKMISQKFSDMELTDLRKWERDAIIHGLGIPPEILGIIESSNRATIDAADYLFARHVVTPRLEFMRAFIQFNLLPIYDDRLVLAYESPVAEDREHNLDIAKVAPWCWSVNEWRAMRGDEPRDDGDVFVIPFNQRIVPNLTPEPSAMRSLAAAPTTATALPCGCDPDDTPTDTKAIIDRAVRQIGGETMTGLALKLSPGMQADIIAAFRALRNSIDIRALMAAFDAGNLEVAMSLISEADVIAELEPARQTLREAVVLVGEESATLLGEFLGVKLAFDLTNPAAVAELEKVGAAMVTNVSDSTIAAIREVLVEAYREGRTASQAAKDIRRMIGLTEPDARSFNRLRLKLEGQGLSESEIADQLDKWVEAKIRYRAQVIAENELVQAGNAGQELLWGQAVDDGHIPPETKRRWVVTPDDRLCVLCAPMAGVEVGLNEPWQTQTGPVLNPNAIHVRCRCTEVLVVRR